MARGSHRFVIAVCVAAALLCLGTLSASADTAGSHPAYLHALTDLRYARALLSHETASGSVDATKTAAIAQIDAAIAELKKAAIDDGKNLNDHPAIDASFTWSNRYVKALETLAKVRSDLKSQEDNPEVRAFHFAFLFHVDEAYILVEKLAH